MTLAGIGPDGAGIIGKSFAGDQPLRDALGKHQFKQLAKGVRLTKSSMPVLGEAGVFWHWVFQA